MEQMRGETQRHQQGQQPTPLKCPRCDSLDTKFRYFNNHSLSQPRHYCRTCKRQWTVGGNLRNIPIGGKPRNSKHKASSSRSSNPRSQTPQPPLPVGDHHSQNSQHSPLMAGMVPQIFDTTMIQPPPMTSSYFNDEISCLDAIQSLIQPDIINQHANAGNFDWGSSSQNMEILQDWNIQSMASQPAIPQEMPRQIESYQAHNQTNFVSSSQFNDSLAQSTWTMNSMPQDVSNNFSFSTSNAGLSNNWNNPSGNITDTEMDATPVNVDEWLNFPGYGPQ